VGDLEPAAALLAVNEHGRPDITNPMEAALSRSSAVIACRKSELNENLLKRQARAITPHLVRCRCDD
jgi:hypothetical protein